MMKKFAVFLPAVMAAGILSFGSLYADETPGPEAAQEAVTEDAQAEIQTEAQTEAEEFISVPENRPDYRALDYVRIDDDEYKKIHLSVYPPADDSPQAQEEYQKTIDTMIMTQLFSLYPVREIPADLMNYTVGNLTQTYREYARMYGMDFAAFLQTYLQEDESTFDAQVKKAAQQTLKEELLLKAVAEKEDITVQDDEYEQGCADYAVRYGYESADALRQAFDEETIRISLLMDKTFAYLESVTQIDLIIETETESESEALTEAETVPPQAGEAALQDGTAPPQAAEAALQDGTVPPQAAEAAPQDETVPPPEEAPSQSETAPAQG